MVEIIIGDREEIEKVVANMMIDSATSEKNILVPTGNTYKNIYFRFCEKLKNNNKKIKGEIANLDGLFGKNNPFCEYMKKHVFDILNINWHVPFNNHPQVMPRDSIFQDIIVSEKEFYRKVNWDIAFGGIGEDGHYAGILPENDNYDDFFWCRWPHYGEGKHYIATVGRKTLKKTKKIVTVAFGDKKTNAIYKTILNKIYGSPLLCHSKKRFKVISKNFSLDLENNSKYIFFIDWQAADKLLSEVSMDEEDQEIFNEYFCNIYQ